MKRNLVQKNLAKMCQRSTGQRAPIAGDTKKASTRVGNGPRSGLNQILKRKRGLLIAAKAENGGDSKGSEGELHWNEVWEDFGEYKMNNKWWSKGLKKWGVKDIREGISHFVEEWEEDNGKFRNVEVKNDGLGNKTQKTTGHGPGYRFTDEFTENLSTGERHETKIGQSPNGSWETKRREQHGEHHVQHKGIDINGSWEEIWYEKGGHKWAKKQGESHLHGKWDETWCIDETVKEAKKHGVNQDNEWWEEWTEWDDRKKCKKEQRWPGLIKIQQWEEETNGNNKHTWGEFLENGAVIKKWDDTYQLS